jgi:hypothetical protein
MFVPTFDSPGLDSIGAIADAMSNNGREPYRSIEPFKK